MSVTTAAVCMTGDLLSPAGVGTHENEPRVIRLWEQDAPGARGAAPEDIPDLTCYSPAEVHASGAAIVICPGGGYGGLAAHEGHDYAQFLAGKGVACFVLKYRLGANGYRYPRIFQDLTRGIRLVRMQAQRWKLDPDRIGVMGSNLHIYQKGGHGMGLGNRPAGTAMHPWSFALVQWLNVQGFIQ